MPVYVDPLIPCRPSPLWPFTFSCHMIADTSLELHNFARRIGLRREWYQCKSALPHYDLSPTKRCLAIRLGAIPIDRREIGRRYIEAKKLQEEKGA